MREFIKEILYEDFGNNYEKIYNSSDLIQYLNKKTGAIDGDSKTRRSLGNIYAIYSLLISIQIIVFITIKIVIKNLKDLNTQNYGIFAKNNMVEINCKIMHLIID